MSSSTDAKIKELFELAAAVRDEDELRRVAQQLRAAMTEHARVRFAPQSVITDISAPAAEV